MPNLKKQQEIKKLIEKFKTMKGLILTEYQGLTVEEISNLRSKLRPFASEYIVVKNTLSKVAFKKVGIEIEGKGFRGPVALVIENGDVVHPAKVVVEFAKANPKLKIKFGFLDGEFINSSVVEHLSSIPSKELLIARLVRSISMPVINLINVLIVNTIKLVVVLDVVAKKRVS
jgi:large subunit ribosomal protein L10